MMIVIKMMMEGICLMGNPWKNRMTKKEMRTLFDLSEKLYWQEQKKSGMSTIPYAWIADDEEGKFIAVSIFGVHSETVRNKLKEII